MLALGRMYLEVWSDKGRGLVSVRGDTVASDKKGLSYVWFVMFEREFREIVTNRVVMMQDGYHKLDVMGDRWTFFDMQVPKRDIGEMTIPYVSIDMPEFVQQILLRQCERIWAAQKDIKGQTDKVVIDLPYERRVRWMRLYGQGKGQVRTIADSDTLARIEQHKSDSEFNRCLARINQIALNRTDGWFDTADVRIGKDLDGYWWSCVSPQGKLIMSGGLVNHSRDESKFDWSIHT